MSQHFTAEGSGTKSVELLSAARFQEELRGIARFRAYPPVGDPLDFAVKRIERSPALAQSRLLTRILAGLVHQEGEFRRAEVAALDSETLAIVISLMDAYVAGTPARDAWVRAVDTVKAAQLGAEG